MMKKHPNEFTRRKVLEYFRERHLDVSVNGVDDGYVIFIRRFSAIEARTVDDPAGRLVYAQGWGGWKLYWMSGKHSWHFYGRYRYMHLALDAMSSDKAANLFCKVL